MIIDQYTLVFACPVMSLLLPVMYPSHPYSVFNVQVKGISEIFLSPNVKKTGGCRGTKLNFFKKLLQFCRSCFDAFVNRSKMHSFTACNLPIG